MLEEFAEFVGQLFPATKPETVRELIKALEKRGGIVSKELYAPQPPTGICQSDIFAPVPFRALLADGTWGEFSGPGLVLTNSCDAERVNYITLAQCLPYGPMRDALSTTGAPGRNLVTSIEVNEVSNLLFLPGVPSVGDLVADFCVTVTIDRRYLERAVSRGDIRRTCAMSLLGYYFFLAKLTLHYMRPESDEVVRPRRVPVTRRDRLREAWRILRR